MKPQSPCYNCKNRKANCHSNCDDYLAYKQELNEYNERRNKQKNIEADYNAFRFRKRK